MLLYLTLWMSKLMQANNFVLQDSYNIILNDKAHYKIDVSINEEDYEMINKEQLEHYIVGDKENKFFELNKLASKEHGRTDNTFMTATSFPDIFHGTEHRTETKMNTENNIRFPQTPTPDKKIKHPLYKRAIVDDTEKLYNYNELFDEYYEESIEKGKSNKTHHASKAAETESGLLHSLQKIILLNKKSGNCTVEEMKQIGFKALNCLIEDYRTNQQPTRTIVKRLWRIMWIWFCVYLAVAVPMWCTKGWCCCCLYCKFLKPLQTIEEAKKYLAINPPGVWKTHKGGEIHYEPTDNEKDRYDEFEHLIRTI